MLIPFYIWPKSINRITVYAMINYTDYYTATKTTLNGLGKNGLILEVIMYIRSMDVYVEIYQK